MASAIHNLTSVKTFDFRDTSYVNHNSITYLYGKHCADSYLHFDHETDANAVESFKNCLDNQYGVLDEWFGSLIPTFERIHEYDSYEWGNVSLLDSELYQRYRLYMSARHNLDIYKSNMLENAKHFSDPLQKLSMSTEEFEALTALNQSSKNVADMKESVDAIIDTFRNSIKASGVKIAAVKADLAVAEQLFNSQEQAYVNNVTDVLRKLCSHPTSLYDCVEGYYCPTETTSNACPAGTFQPSRSMTVIDACIQCPLQTYSLAGAANCTTCASNNHMGATACHLRSLGEVLATMDAAGPIQENFYIAYDVTRSYVTAQTTLLSAQATALGAGKGTIRTAASIGGPSRYLATSSVTIGASVDAKTFKWSKAGESFQINLERNSLVAADSSADPVAGSIEYWNGDRSGAATGHMDNGNWIDGNLYEFHMDPDATELPIYTYGATPAFVQEAGIQWTITAWGQTVLRGMIDTVTIPGKTRFVVKLGANGLPEYRPFDASLDVNPQEQFTQANTELIAYVFDGTIANLVADTSVLVPELLTTTAEERYVAETSAVFAAAYGTQAYQTALAETDLKSAEVIAQSDLTQWAGPYIDGSSNYALALTDTTWSVSYTPTAHVILSGTRAGKTLTGTPSDRGMIEFPVSLGGAAGFPVVSKDGTPIHSYQLK